MNRIAILVGEKGLRVADFKDMKFWGPPEFVQYDEKTDSLYVRYPDRRYVSFEYAPEVRNEYEPEEFAKFPFRDPDIIYVEYSDIDTLGQILHQKEFPKGLYMDDTAYEGGETIGPVEEFNPYWKNWEERAARGEEV